MGHSEKYIRPKSLPGNTHSKKHNQFYPHKKVSARGTLTWVQPTERIVQVIRPGLGHYLAEAEGELGFAFLHLIEDRFYKVADGWCGIV